MTQFAYHKWYVDVCTDINLLLPRHNLLASSRNVTVPRLTTVYGTVIGENRYKIVNQVNPQVVLFSDNHYHIFI